MAAYKIAPFGKTRKSVPVTTSLGAFAGRVRKEGEYMRYYVFTPSEFGKEKGLTELTGKTINSIRAALNNQD